MLQAAAGLQIIVTSRARLNVQGEHLLPLGGMDLPPTDLVDPTCATQYSAVQLYLQGARRVEPGFALGGDNVADVVRICHLVEGIPLALLLAAAWLRALSPAEIAAEVEQSIDILASEGRDVPARQRSMRAVFDHSWRLLDAHQQQVLAALSVFRGGCAREAAQEVTGASLRDLMALVDRSLLVRTPSGRYEMHELLRQYAAERLNESPAEYPAVHDRHAVYYARAIEQRYDSFQRFRRQIDISQIEPDIENARATWDWAVEHKRETELGRAAQGLFTLYQRGRYREGEAAFGRAAQALEKAVSIGAQRVRAVALRCQAEFLVSLGDNSHGRSCHQQSLALLRQLASMEEDTRREEADALLAYVYEAIHRDLLEAERLGQMALGLYSELDDHLGQSSALFALGLVALSAGQRQVAREWYEASAALSRAMGHEWDLAITLGSLGWVDLAQGRLDQAEQEAREMVAFFEGGETPYHEWTARALLAGVYAARGEFAAARELLTETLVHFQEMGDQPLISRMTDGLSLVELHLGHYQEAERRARAVQAMADETGQRSEQPSGLHLEAQVALAQRQYDRAIRCLQQSLEVYREWDPSPSEVLTTLSYVWLARGDLGQAKRHLHEATCTVVTSEDFLGKLNLLPAVALYLAVQGKTERAVELYALATRYPYVANSRWFEDVAGRHIRAAAEALPPDVVAAAQARGRACDLWATVKALLDGGDHRMERRTASP